MATPGLGHASNLSTCAGPVAYTGKLGARHAVNSLVRKGWGHVVAPLSTRLALKSCSAYRFERKARLPTCRCAPVTSVLSWQGARPHRASWIWAEDPLSVKPGRSYSSSLISLKQEWPLLARAAEAAAVTLQDEESDINKEVEWWEEVWIDAEWLEEEEYNDNINEEKLQELMDALARRLQFKLELRKMLEGLDKKMVQAAAKQVAMARYGEKEVAFKTMQKLAPFVELTHKSVEYADMVEEEEAKLRKAYMEQLLSDEVSPLWDSKGAGVRDDPIEFKVYNDLPSETASSLARTVVRAGAAGVDISDFLAIEIGQLPNDLQEQISAAEADYAKQERLRMEQFQQGDWLPPTLAADLADEQDIANAEPWEMWLEDESEAAEKRRALEAARWQWLAQQAAFLRAYRRRVVARQVEERYEAWKQEEEAVLAQKEAAERGGEGPRDKASETTEAAAAAPSGFETLTPAPDPLREPKAPSPAEYDPFILQVEKMAKMGMLPPLKHNDGRVLVSEVARAKALHHFMKRDRLKRERAKKALMGIDYYLTGAAEGAPIGPQGGRYFEGGGKYEPKPKQLPSDEDPQYRDFPVKESELDKLFEHFKQQDEFHFRHMDDIVAERDPLNWDVTWKDVTRVMHGDLKVPVDTYTQDPSKILDFSGWLWDRYPMAEADWAEILRKDGVEVHHEGEPGADRAAAMFGKKRKVVDIGMGLSADDYEEEEAEEEDNWERDELLEMIAPDDERMSPKDYKQAMIEENKIAARVLRELHADEDEEFFDFRLDVEDKVIKVSQKDNSVKQGPKEKLS